MLRLTSNLRKATARRERAEQALRKKTLRAAVHLQELLKDGEVGIYSRVYRTIGVTWWIEGQENDEGQKPRHLPGRAVLSVRKDPKECWTAVYDPREPMISKSGMVFEPVGNQLIDALTDLEVFLPDNTVLITFASDYPELVKILFEKADHDRQELENALKGLENHAEKS